MIRVSKIPKYNHKRLYLKTKKEIDWFINEVNTNPTQYNFSMSFLQDNNMYLLYCDNDKLSAGVIYNYVKNNPIMNVEIQIPDDELLEYLYKNRLIYSKMLTVNWYK